MKKCLPLLLAYSASLGLPQLVTAAPMTSLSEIRNYDPAAIALLDRSVRAYNALDGLSMAFSVYDYTNGKATTLNGSLAYSRSGKAKLDYVLGKKSYQMATDGEKLYQSPENGEIEFDEYKTGKAGDTNPDGSVVLARGLAIRYPYHTSYLLEQPPLQAFAQQIPTGLSVPFAFLLVGENPLTIESPLFKDIPLNWEKVAVLPDNGVTLSTSFGKGSPPVEFRLFFGKNDMLLRRVEAKVVVKGETMRNITSISQVRLNPDFAPDDLKFRIYPGSKEDLTPPPYNPKLKLGADPLPLNGIDLRKYQGKVLLLDFRDASFGKYQLGLPEAKQMYKKYHAQGFEVLGVLRSDDDAEANRTIQLMHTPWTQILDSRELAKSNTHLYGVSELWFNVLVGKDGKVAAIRLPPEGLEKAIQKALENR